MQFHKQRFEWDCTTAALASLLNVPYEDVELCDGRDTDKWSIALSNSLTARGLYMLSIPAECLDKLSYQPGEVLCLVTVLSARFPGRHHHVVGELKVDSKEYVVNVIHDPYEPQAAYSLVSVDLVFPLLH